MTKQGQRKMDKKAKTETEPFETLYRVNFLATHDGKGPRCKCIPSMHRKTVTTKPTVVEIKAIAKDLMKSGEVREYHILNHFSLEIIHMSQQNVKQILCEEMDGESRFNDRFKHIKKDVIEEGNIEDIV